MINIDDINPWVEVVDVDEDTYDSIWSDEFNNLVSVKIQKMFEIYFQYKFMIIDNETGEEISIEESETYDNNRSYEIMLSVDPMVSNEAKQRLVKLYGSNARTLAVSIVNSVLDIACVPRDKIKENIENYKVNYSLDASTMYDLLLNYEVYIAELMVIHKKEIREFLDILYLEIGITFNTTTFVIRHQDLKEDTIYFGNDECDIYRTDIGTTYYFKSGFHKV